MKIVDFMILSGKTTEELTAAVRSAIKEGWEPLDSGFQVEYLDQTAANYVMAMVKLKSVRVTTAKPTGGRTRNNSSSKKKTKAKKQ